MRIIRTCLCLTTKPNLSCPKSECSDVYCTSTCANELIFLIIPRLPNFNDILTSFNYIWCAKSSFYMPGPASTVEERLLRKIFVRGDRGSIPAEDYFSDAIIRNMFDGKSNYRTGSSNLATSIRKGCSGKIYYCMKRNVALEIGPMTKLLSGRWHHIIYYATPHYTTLKI